MSSPGDAVTIIAEVGVNHNGSLESALQLVEAAAACGADAVKFQTFRTEALVSRRADKAAYQRRETGANGSQFDMLRRLELDETAHELLLAHCRRHSVAFMSSPFDEASADLLDRLGVDRYKLGSGELTNLPLLRHVARKGRPVILSTGMSTLGEVEVAVDALRAHGCLDLTLLHCVTEYPAPVGEVNLRALHTLAEAFGLPVGYSDHTEGDAVAFAAVAMGARVIEKHFTLDRAMPGPDHRASLEPAAFAALVRGIRDVTSALGDGRKRPAPCELPNIPVARKSVVAVRPVARGAVISRLDLAIKRPGHGVAPADLERVVGRRAAVDLAPDDVITWEVLA